MKELKLIHLFFAIVLTGNFSLAQGFISSYDVPAKMEKKSSSEVFLNYKFAPSYGYGSTIGINHLKELSSRTTFLIGASYTSYRISAFNGDRSHYIPSSSTNLRSEIRYNLTPRNERINVYAFGALNYRNISFAVNKSYNLGMEFGGEIRYKVSENVFIWARASMYNGNFANNHYDLYNPLNTFR